MCCTVSGGLNWRLKPPRVADVSGGFIWRLKPPRVAGVPGAEAPEGSRDAAHEREADALRAVWVHVSPAQLHELAHEE